MRKLSRMTPGQLRLAYILEFLVALVAIFTAWSEIGGQAVLDLMHWGWKLGLAIPLAAAIAAFTAAIVAEESLWTGRSVRWLIAILILIAGMFAVTHYYMQVEATTPEDNGANPGAISAVFRFGVSA
ncbi:MAG TPA: hypothetical protein VF283_11895 [Bryobacteraceae bacterium]